jgi:hypothetical protein
MSLHRIDAPAEAGGQGAPYPRLDHASGPGAHDPVEAYFECITTCSLDDGECVTSCTEILRQHT